jgi:hypothetical protein
MSPKDTPREAHREGSRIAPTYSQPNRFTPAKDTVPIAQGARWALGPVWTGAENLAPLAFDPRTAQPVARRCTNYAIPTACLTSYLCLILFIILTYLQCIFLT